MSKATKSILILAGLYGFAVGFGVIEGINLSNKWWCRELQAVIDEWSAHNVEEDKA